MRLIEEKELVRLLENSEKLDRLECAGVDNWEGYDYALNDEIDSDDLSYYEYEKLSDEEKLQDYPKYRE